LPHPPDKGDQLNIASTKTTLFPEHAEYFHRGPS